MSLLELTAVVFAVLYLVLAIKENVWCWFFGFLSTLIYLFIFWDVSLYSESLLQIFYLAMSVYGWWQWTHFDSSQSELKEIQQWSILKHTGIIVAAGFGSLALGFFMSQYTSAAFPYIDAATTLFAIVATYMVAQKIIENWIYWMVIDSVSIYLYINRELYLTALLFLLYVALCFVGYFSWRKHMEAQLNVT
jgi:nicotinamide mononucleotide transporter